MSVTLSMLLRISQRKVDIRDTKNHHSIYTKIINVSKAKDFF